MKWKGRGRKQPWPNLINYIVLYLAERRKTTKTLRVGDLWDSTWMGTSRTWNRRATFSNVTFAHSYCFQFCVIISTISRDADTHPPSSLNVKMVGLCLWVTQNVQSSVMHGGNLFITLWRLKERKGVTVLSFMVLQDNWKSLKVPMLHPLVLLVRVVLRGRLVWSNDRMILMGE